MFKTELLEEHALGGICAFMLNVGQRTRERSYNVLYTMSRSYTSVRTYSFNFENSSIAVLYKCNSSSV